MVLSKALRERDGEGRDWGDVMEDGFLKDAYWRVRWTWRNLRRLAKWAPVIWNDFEGDWSTILSVWAFKLRQAKEHIEEHQIIEDWKETADGMGVCLGALERLAADDYCSAEFRAYFEKYPTWPTSEQRPDGTIVHVPMPEDQRAEFCAIRDMEEARRKADLDLFCSSFSKYRGWWD